LLFDWFLIAFNIKSYYFIATVTYPTNAGGKVRVRIKTSQGVREYDAIAGNNVYSEVLVFRNEQGQLIAYGDSSGVSREQTTKFVKTRRNEVEVADRSYFKCIYLTDGSPIAFHNKANRFQRLVNGVTWVMGLTKNGFLDDSDFDGGLHTGTDVILYDNGAERLVPSLPALVNHLQGMFISMENDLRVARFGVADKTTEYQWLGGNLFYRADIILPNDRKIGFFDANETNPMAFFEYFNEFIGESIVSSTDDTTNDLVTNPPTLSNPFDTFWSETFTRTQTVSVDADFSGLVATRWLDPLAPGIAPIPFSSYSSTNTLEFNYIVATSMGAGSAEGTGAGLGAEFSHSFTSKINREINYEAMIPVTKTKQVLSEFSLVVPERTDTLEFQGSIFYTASGYTTEYTPPGWSSPLFPGFPPFVTGSTLGEVWDSIYNQSLPGAPDIGVAIYNVSREASFSETTSPDAALPQNRTIVKSSRVTPLLTTLDVAHGIYIKRQSFGIGSNATNATPQEVMRVWQGLSLYEGRTINISGSELMVPVEMFDSIPMQDSPEPPPTDPNIPIGSEFRGFPYQGGPGYMAKFNLASISNLADCVDFTGIERGFVIDPNFVSWTAGSGDGGYKLVNHLNNTISLGSPSFARDLSIISDPNLPDTISSNTPVTLDILQNVDSWFIQKQKPIVSLYGEDLQVEGDLVDYGFGIYPAVTSRPTAGFYASLQSPTITSEFKRSPILVSPLSAIEVLIFARKSGVNRVYRAYPDAGNDPNASVFNVVVKSVESIGFIPPPSVDYLDDGVSDLFYFSIYGCSNLLFPRPRYNQDGKKIDEKAYTFSMRYNDADNSYSLYQFENVGFNYKNIELIGKGKKAAVLKYDLRQRSYSSTTYWEMRYIETQYHKTLPTVIVPGEVSSSLISFYPPR
jgi:hypothetical protein